MALRARQKELLARLGLTAEIYYVEGYPPVWGHALQRNSEDVMVIETYGCHTDDDRFYNRYMVRRARSVEGSPHTEPLVIRRTLRECLAEAARMAVR